VSLMQCTGLLNCDGGVASRVVRIWTSATIADAAPDCGIAAPFVTVSLPSLRVA
jgi:hypothetical protein